MQKLLLIFSTLLALLFAQCPAFASSYPIPGSTEDAAHSSGDRGVMPLGVRKDANDTALSGTDGDYTPISVNDVGNVKVQLEPTRKATYAVSMNGTCAASTTDFAALFGNASTVVKIQRIEVCLHSWYTPTAGVINLTKRSTANSGGTSSSGTVVKFDSASASAGSTPVFYTANPTLGTSAGVIKTRHWVAGGNTYYTIGASGTAVGGEPMVLWDALTMGGPLTLRGTSEGICLHGNGATIGGTTYVSIIWTEE